MDLAYRDARALGIVTLDDSGGRVSVETYRPGGLSEPGALDPKTLARYLSELAALIGATRILLDGPQAWKDPANGLEHCRRCERLLNCQAKTGLPGVVKPRPYAPFVTFSIAVFDELDGLAWPRLGSPEQLASSHRVAIESYPHAAWRGIGLPSLPAKRKAPAAAVEAARRGLARALDADIPADATHDELQAIVAATALLPHGSAAPRVVGDPPARMDGFWREGYIVLP